MTERDRPAWWAAAEDWGPTVLVAVLSQAGVGASRSWTGSDLTLAVASLALALPLLLRRRTPLGAGALVAVAAMIQIPWGDSLGFGAFLAVMFAAYSLGRHEASTLRAVLGVVVLVSGAIVAGSMESQGMSVEVVIPVIYVTGIFALGRAVRRFAWQAARLRELNAGLEREREQQAQLAVAAERLRIARELHDVVAHRIMLMVIQAEAAVEVLDADPARASVSLTRIQEAGRQGLDDLRGLVRVLRAGPDTVSPPSLEDLPALVTVLREAGLDVQLEHSGDVGEVPSGVQESVFRIVQEALTNVLKHSAAGNAQVAVSVADERLSVDVRDPGPALTDGPAQDGQGLRGMAERLAAYGGTVVAGPDGTGFRVRAEVPS